jgi:hypothetical protein
MSDLTRRNALTASVGAAVAAGLLRPESLVADERPAESQRPRVDHYTTAPGAELIAKLALSSPKKFKYNTLYQLKLPNLRKGDVVQAHAQFEVTNDLRVPVSLAHAMLLHAKRTIVKDHPSQPQDRQLCEYAGEFLTPEMHHGFRSLMGSFAATVDGDAWVSVVIYGVITNPLPGQALTVEKNYGGLRAIVIRNA